MSLAASGPSPMVTSSIGPYPSARVPFEEMRYHLLLSCSTVINERLLTTPGAYMIPRVWLGYRK